MIFWQLFLTFSKIGIVNFGGGYAMLSLIQAEVVERHGWLTAQEFTDIVAISQMTPGPIGVNAATYVGYSAVLAEGYDPWVAALGAALATLSVIWLPFILMLVLGYFILRYRQHPLMRSVFSVLRPTIVGLIAAAALLLMTEDNFGSPLQHPWHFAVSLVLFSLGFVAVYHYKRNPLLVMGVAALLGLAIFPWI